MEQFEAYMKVLKLWRNGQPQFGGHNDHKQLKKEKKKTKKAIELDMCQG